MRKQVLVVEDDKQLGRALTRAIQAEGYGVKVVHDGQAACDALREGVPGMVLLDLLLPKRDGRAVLEWIRGREETSELPVVVMSGVLKSRGHAKEFEQAGAQGFLDKPFRRSELRAVMRRHLGRPPSQAAKGSDEPTIAQKPVAKVVWELAVRKFTGAVEFKAGKRVKVLVLKEGTPVFIRSNLAKECLGQRLAADGVISREQLDESVRRLRDPEFRGKRQGDILVEMNVLTSEQVERALADQALDKVLQLFSWSEGEINARERIVEVAQASDLGEWSARRLILAGVEAMSESLAQELLTECADTEIERKDVQLEALEGDLPHVARLLDSLETARPVRELVLEHARVLYGLEVIGAVDLGRPEPPKSEPAEAAGPGADDLKERLERAQGQNYFELLGVPEGADIEAVRRAYLELAKRFHPDRMRDDAQRKLAADLFGRMSEAHETLVHTTKRDAYLESLRAKRAGGEGPVTTAIVAAELQFQRGEVMFKKRDYAGALTHFEAAHELNDQEGEFHAYLGWCRMLVSPDDEDVREQAKTHLETAIKLAPRAVSGYYFYGLQRKACGDADMAERMFRKVLEIQPNHVEANRELRLASMRREKGSKDGGLFGFTRKK